MGTFHQSIAIVVRSLKNMAPIYFTVIFVNIPAFCKIARCSVKETDLLLHVFDKDENN